MHWLDGRVPVPASSPLPPPPSPVRLRQVVLTVAGLNFAWFWVEAAVALAIGSVALFADSVDFLEDTSINLLIAMALGWGARHRAIAGKVMAGILLVPAAAAVWQAVAKWGDPVPPDVGWLVVTAGSAALVNGFCAWLLDAGPARLAAACRGRHTCLLATTSSSISRSSPWPW